MSEAPTVIDDLVYDIGLHDGVDTGFYLRSGHRVVAVDADPEAIESAGKRFGEAIERGRLTLVHGAIAPRDAPETVTLYLSDHRDWSSLVPQIAGRDGVGIHEVEVPTVSIARLLSQFGTPEYLKIDIEGMDGVALEDLAETAARPTYVSVEAECADDSGQSDGEALAKLDLLVGMGYKRFKLVDQDSLRVLSLDDLELGPRRDVRSRFRARLGATPRERSAVLDVVGRRTAFRLGATGPFGPDLAGEWLGEKNARRLLGAARLTYFSRDDAVPYGFWCDWHATSQPDELMSFDQRGVEYPRIPSTTIAVKRSARSSVSRPGVSHVYAQFAAERTSSEAAPASRSERTSPASTPSWKSARNRSS